MNRKLVWSTRRQSWIDFEQEDIFRIAEGLREFLGEFPELSNYAKHAALKIVTKNFKDSLKK